MERDRTNPGLRAYPRTAWLRARQFGSALLGTAAVLWLSGCTERTHARASEGLVVLLPRDVLELDPRFVSDPYGLKVTRLIFASLMRIDPLTLEIVPDLAEHVEQLGPTVYEITLRENLRFSDGSVLDSQDVLATFRGLRDPKLHSRYASSYARISRVEALDARRVRFELNGPHATFLTDLEIPIVRAEDGIRRMPNAPGQFPIGAGPYLLTQREPGRLELRANPHWYAGRAKYPELQLIVVRDDNTRALRLLAGAGDLALSAIPPGLIPLFRRDQGFEIAAARGVGTTYIGINTEAPALRDVRVRRALAYAIDRRTLIAAKLGGRAELASSFIPPGHWAHANDTQSYDYDPARARALLDAAGLPARPDAPRLALSLRCASDRSRLSVARAIVAMLAQVGVLVDLMPTETASMIADLDRGQFELTILQLPEVIEPHVLYWFFGRDRIPGPGREGSNRWRYTVPALEQALERGRSRVERAQRTAAYQDVQRLLAEALPVIPLWHEDVVAVRGPSAHGFVVPRDGRFTTFAR